MSNRDSQERENTRFGGYGDRVGSAIELAPVTWKGGEVRDKDKKKEKGQRDKKREA